MRPKRPGVPALFLLLSVSVLGFLPRSAAEARILRVSPNGDGTDGTTWERAYNSLSNALIAAASGDDLWVAAGVYHESIDLKSGVDLFGGFSGSEAENEFDLRDWQTNETIIDATGLNDNVIKCTSIESAIIEGFILMGGRATQGGGVCVIDSTITFYKVLVYKNLTVQSGKDSGGGLFAEDSRLHLSDVEITRNTGRLGGGIYLQRGDVIVKRCNIHNNGTAVGRLGQGGVGGTLSGGGIYAIESIIDISNSLVCENVANVDGGGLQLYSTPATIRSTTISNNTVQIESGGGIRCSNSDLEIYDSVIAGNRANPSLFTGQGGGLRLSGNSRVENCVISSNLANDGGGIYVAGGTAIIVDTTLEQNQARWGGGVSSESFASLSRCLIRNNRGTLGAGIAIDAKVTIEDCSIISNHANQWGYDSSSFNGAGGGVFIFNRGLFFRCVIANNDSENQGGGIWIDGGGQSEFHNCLIVGNSARSTGGGAFLRRPYTEPTFSYCTFVNNDCPVGSTLFVNTAQPRIAGCLLIDSSTHTIVEENDSTYVQYYGESADTQITYSNVSGGWPGEGNIDEDPLFLDPEIGDYRLQPGSPCVDSASTEGPINDLDGNPRPRDVGGIGRNGLNAFDMGAYEVQTPFANSLVDVNGDGIVNWTDLFQWTRDWMKEK